MFLKMPFLIMGPAKVLETKISMWKFCIHTACFKPSLFFTSLLYLQVNPHITLNKDSVNFFYEPLKPSDDRKGVQSQSPFLLFNTVPLPSTLSVFPLKGTAQSDLHLVPPLYHFFRTLFFKIMHSAACFIIFLSSWLLPVKEHKAQFSPIPKKSILKHTASFDSTLIVSHTSWKNCLHFTIKIYFIFHLNLRHNEKSQSSLESSPRPFIKRKTFNDFHLLSVDCFLPHYSVAF